MEAYGEYESEAEAQRAYLENSDNPQGDLDGAWILHRHFGDAVDHVREIRNIRGRTYGLDGDIWSFMIRGWSNCIEDCPWRAEMQAEIDAFRTGGEYPRTDTNIEPLLQLAVEMSRCDVIDRLIPRLQGPIRRPACILDKITRKVLLPALRSLLDVCVLRPEDEAAIYALTRKWMLPYTFLALRAAFTDSQLTHKCMIESLSDLQANGVRLHSYEVFCDIPNNLSIFGIGRLRLLQKLAPLTEEEKRSLEGTSVYEALLDA